MRVDLPPRRSLADVLVPLGLRRGNILPHLSIDLADGGNGAPRWGHPIRELRDDFVHDPFSFLSASGLRARASSSNAPRISASRACSTSRSTSGKRERSLDGIASKRSRAVTMRPLYHFSTT